MDKIAAALGLLACALLALWLAVGPLRQQRFAGACRRLQRTLSARVARIAWMRRRTPTAAAVDPDAARREADQLIQRARQRRHDVDQDGNVIRPRAFDRSRKKPPLH